MSIMNAEYSRRLNDFATIFKINPRNLNADEIIMLRYVRRIVTRRIEELDESEQWSQRDLPLSVCKLS
jgi:hypothetical protein